MFCMMACLYRIWSPGHDERSGVVVGSVKRADLIGQKRTDRESEQAVVDRYHVLRIY